MKHHRKAPLTRQQVIDCFRWMRTGVDAGESITSHQFLEHTGVTMREIRRHFGSWSGLRRELGLYHRARPRKRWSVDDLCREFHSCVVKLGKLPSVQEFDRITGISASTFYRRIGNMKKFQSVYGVWLRKQHWPDANVHNPQIDANPPRDVVWIRRKWFSLRVGFELRSSDFRGREPDACDFLVVLEHDWPACPVRILELHQVLLPGSDAGSLTRANAETAPLRA
jgi:hypothetical protein